MLARYSELAAQGDTKKDDPEHWFVESKVPALPALGGLVAADSVHGSARAQFDLAATFRSRIY